MLERDGSQRHNKDLNYEWGIQVGAQDPHSQCHHSSQKYLLVQLLFSNLVLYSFAQHWVVSLK